MSSNEFLIDSASRHSVFLQRFSRRLERMASNDVENALKGVISELSKEDLEALSVGRRGSLRISIVDDYSKSLERLTDSLWSELEDLGINEEEFSREMLSKVVKDDVDVSAVEDLSTPLRSTTMDVESGQKITIPQMLSAFSRRKAENIDNMLFNAFSEGITTQELSGRVRDITNLHRHQAAALARTGVNSVSSISRFESIKANDDILDGYEWVSTLDGRTSLICMSRDGIVYDTSPRSPKPPAHYNCRSTIIPKIKDAFDLLSGLDGDRPSVGAKGPKNVSAKTTYGGWLSRQPASFQDRALGPVRAKLFRQGGLSIDKFVDPTGEELTIEQLRASNPFAFEKANID